MPTEQILEVFFNVIGGLGLFLLGMKSMSDGLQTIAGEKLRRLIGMVTNNRVLATLVGTSVTCVIQSSSITTVMVVGFVNSSLMTLKQAIGVILGANIGTTITGWILALNIGKYGLPLLGVMVLVYLFSKNEKIKYTGLAFLGIGMVFVGLEIMKNGFTPIREYPEFVRWFHAFSADTYWGMIKCISVGCIVTLIVQSSSATVGITMGLAATGVINFESAAALVLGENIGTTITAYLASLGTSTNAKRAAYAHIIFNVVGVIWVSSIFQLYLSVIRYFIGADPNTMVMVNNAETFPYVQAGIAMVHSVFNISNTIVFMPFVGYLAKFLTKFVPDKSFVEPPKLTHLEETMFESPMLAIEQSHKELIIMGEHNRKMLDYLKTVLIQKTPDQAIVKKIFHREEILDSIQKEIMVFLAALLSGANIPQSLSEEAQQQMRLADEYESVSDYITAIAKLYLRIRNDGKVLPDYMLAELIEFHDIVSGYFSLINDAYKNEQKSVITKAGSRSDEITHQFRQLRSKHLARLAETKMDPLLSTTYPDLLNCYRRVKDHAYNIAETLAGQD